MLGEIHELGGQLVAVSPEILEVAQVTADKNQLTFDVLSDAGNAVAKSYGLVFDVPRDLQDFYQSLGIDLATHNGAASGQLPLAATFVIDRAGVVRAAFADADYVKRMEPAEILATLRVLNK